MNAEHLLTHFDRLADAPDAIPRLRRFILDLAVRGKLVEQDPEDEPAGELLKRIAAEKKRLVESGEIRKPKKAPLIDDSSLLFGVPPGWVWARLLDISRKIHYGFTASANQQIADVRLLRITDIQHNKVEWRSVPGCEIDEKTLPSFKLEMGDILIARTGGTIGKSFLVAEIPLIAVFASYLIRIQGSHEIYARYLKFFLESPVYWKQLQEGTRGAGQPNVNGQTLGTMLVPLPPLAEQHRIVAKVDELMALCDRMETARKEREATRDRLATASLAHLNAPDPDPAVFQNHAAFALNNLTPLTTRPDQVKALRQTILNLAVRGKLVEQDPEDEPAGELLKRIATHREATAKAATVRFKKPVAPATDATPVDLPDGWAIEALANLVNPTAKISYGVLVPGPDVEDGIPFVRTQDLYLSGHPDRPSKKISPEIEASYARTRLRGGEILLCVVGSIGKLGIVPRAWIGANIARAVARIAPVEQLSSGYLLLSLRYEQSQSYFTDTTRTLAQPTLNVGLIEKLPIPLPPLAEQHRIVAKVDELMALCDRLEAGLAAGDETRGRLVEAMLRETLATGRPVI